MVNKYCQKYKERPQKETHERHQNLSEEEKYKRRQFYQKRKQKLPEYRILCHFPNNDKREV